MKTTVNMKDSQYEKISSFASQFNTTMSFIVNSLAKKALKQNKFKVRIFHKVQYQDRLIDEGDSWHPLPVSFDAVVYEKCHDMKKFFKLSVSFFICDAIDNDLDQLILELQQGTDSYNYSPHYIIFITKSGNYLHMTILWDMVEQEKLIKVKETHIQLE